MKYSSPVFTRYPNKLSICNPKTPMKKTQENHPRRKLLLSIPAIAAVGVTGAMAADSGDDKKAKKKKKPTAKKDKPVEYLFVQTAEKVTFDEKTRTMTLVDVSPTTLFFSDRPERITGHGRTAEYVADWAKGEDSFESEPPNASLCIMGDDDKHIAEAVVVLTKPVFKDGNLSYTVEVLDGELPAAGGACSLFVDVIGRPLTPLSVAGVARRTVRRIARC